MSLFTKMMNEYYTERLAEHGYVKVKGRYPYWAKMVGDEIVLIITYASEMANGTKPLEAFSLWGTVATVYRPKIDFEHSPKSQRSYMVDARRLYGNRVGDAYTAEEGKKRLIFQCNGANEDSVMEVCEKSYKVCEEEIVSRLDMVKTLEEVKEFYEEYLNNLLSLSVLRNKNKYYNAYYSEGLLWPILYSLEEYERMKWNKYYEYNNRYLEKKLKNGFSITEIETNIENRKHQIIDIIGFFKVIKEQVNEIKNKNRTSNYSILREKGIIEGE